MIIPLLSGEKEPRLLVCSPLHHRLSKKDGIWSHKRISRCPSFSQRAPSVSGALAAGGGCGRTAEAKGVAGGPAGVSQCPADSSFNTGLRRPGFRKQPQVASRKVPGRPSSPSPAPGARGATGRQGPRCSCSWWRVKACHRSSPGTARTRPGRTLPWG